MISQLAEKIVKTLDEKKALDIKVIKVEELSILADYFIIATGTSNTHVKALAGDVEDALTKDGVEPQNIEGRATGWILLDYGTVIVHVFLPVQREFYNLERLWADAAQEDISYLLTD